MGQPVEITRLEHSASELRAFAAKIKDSAIARRLLALALVLEGHSRELAATMNGMTRQTCVTGFIATMPRVWPVCDPTLAVGPRRC
jgi:hypothetical protein